MMREYSWAFGRSLIIISKLFLLNITLTLAYRDNIEIINQWNLLNLDFPDQSFVNNFRPDRTVVTGMEITEDRIFIGMPRIYTGVSATLTYIPRNLPPGANPILRAYPNWSFHEAARDVNASCSGLISVYRFKLDSCNRLWVLDSGITASLETFQTTCPPKIVVIDLQTDQVVRTVLFPREVIRPSSLLTNLVIDESIQGACDSAFVYITDTVFPGLIVYDSLKETAWRVTHPSMFPDPDFAEVVINGETMTLMDGIVGLTLSPNLGTLYYQPIATNRLFSIPTAALRKGPPAELEALPISLVGTKSSQGLALAVNLRDDSLIFSPFSETSITSWSPLNNKQKLLAFNPEKLQFVCDLKWLPEDESLWVMSSRFHKYFRRSINSQDINIRIMRIPKSATKYKRPLLF